MPSQSVEEVLASYAPFVGRIDEEFRSSLEKPATFQVNVGYRCNIACRHCHLGCSPARTEEMDRETMQACLDACVNGGFSTLDLTGGAPEMNPHLEWMIKQATARGIDTIVRTNLVILLEDDYAHFLDVYANNQVHLFASLPYYAAGNVDKVRGDGIFDGSIRAIRLLNQRGYGTGTHTLTLVFGPTGPSLPPDAVSLEAEYHRNLEADFDVYFDDLVCMTNMPCGRFAEALNRKGKLGRYIEKLIDAFNAATVPSMMCRNQISVDWQGRLYDCDFNQAMGVPTPSGETVFDWVSRPPQVRPIAFRNWCYACTAGAGSS